MQTILNDLTVVFLGIVLESLPFVLLGSLIAAVINLFISEDVLWKIIPKNQFLGLITVSLLGIIFPVCDCTIIPIMRRLLHKGLPVSLAVTFMCAVPIVNPTVIASTLWAFTDQLQIVWLRLIVGMWTAVAAGFIIGKLTNERNPLLGYNVNDHSSHGCSCCNSEESFEFININGNKGNKNVIMCGCDHRHDNFSALRKIGHKIQEILTHTTNEFIDSASLIVLGASISATIQIFIPRTIMYPLSTAPVLSVGAMMGFTWLLSLCANADAFVAKSFYGIFTTGSLIVFMTFGQMIDMKNTVVMLGFFKKRFVIVVLVTIAILCMIWGIMINSIGNVI